MRFGNKFKKYRLKAGLTQNETAEMIGIKGYQLGNYETDRSEPSISVLIGMSKVYNVSIDTLVGNPRKGKDKYLFNIDELEERLQEYIDFIEKNGEDE